MLTPGFLDQGRRAAESLMTDECTVRRDPVLTTDPDTGETSESYTVVHTGRPCKVQSATAQGTEPTAGEHRFLVESPEVHLPLDTDAQAGDEVLITASDTFMNTGLVFKLNELERGTHRTAQRWSAEVITR